MKIIVWRNISKLCAGIMLTTSLFLGSAMASTVTVDGVKMAGEYTGTNSGMIQLLWFNDHHSIYDEAAGNMNPLYWEITETTVDTITTFNLNLFFEVPTYARRMIWVKDCRYGFSSADSDCGVIPTAYLDAYLMGSHHFNVDPDGDSEVQNVKMDYNKQTGSEYFQLNGLLGDFKIDWQDVDDVEDDITWATSLEYLLTNGICTEDLCLEFNMTASIELMFSGLLTLGSGSPLE